MEDVVGIHVVYLLSFRTDLWHKGMWLGEIILLHELIVLVDKQTFHLMNHLLIYSEVDKALLRYDPISIIISLAFYRLILIIKHIRNYFIKGILLLHFLVVDLKIYVSWKVNVAVLD